MGVDLEPPLADANARTLQIQVFEPQRSYLVGPQRARPSEPDDRARACIDRSVGRSEDRVDLLDVGRICRTDFDLRVGRPFIGDCSSGKANADEFGGRDMQR